jgi:putative solute:sodium symporter small subunit
MTTDTPPPSEIASRESEILQRYWRSNLRLMAVLLIIWAAVSLGCGILFADVLNQFELPGTGYPLGFWFAQQGSILIFVLLILVYAVRMNQLDRIHHLEREALGPVEDKEAPFSREGI